MESNRKIEIVNNVRSFVYDLYMVVLILPLLVYIAFSETKAHIGRKIVNRAQK